MNVIQPLPPNLLAVGTPRDQRRKFSALGRTENINIDRDAVTHLNRNISLENYVHRKGFRTRTANRTFRQGYLLGLKSWVTSSRSLRWQSFAVRNFCRIVPIDTGRNISGHHVIS
ncbi:hypothetical protein D3C87_1537960 [compost metagenome]